MAAFGIAEPEAPFDANGCVPLLDAHVLAGLLYGTSCMTLTLTIQLSLIMTRLAQGGVGPAVVGCQACVHNINRLPID